MVLELEEKAFPSPKELNKKLAIKLQGGFEMIFFQQTARCDFLCECRKSVCGKNSGILLLQPLQSKYFVIRSIMHSGKLRFGSCFLFLSHECVRNLPIHLENAFQEVSG